jgi:hypothetical protein
MSEERKAELDRHLNESYDQELQKYEKEVLESCTWAHEGTTDCNCEELVKELREQRTQWRKTLEKGAGSSTKTVDK